MITTVGRVAQELGISPSTILLWEREGLIKAKRTSGGWRIFDEAGVAKLKRILRKKRAKRATHAPSR